jgi:cell division protein FtsW
MNAPARRTGYALDPLLFGAVSSLLLLGLVAVASASMALGERDLGRPFYYLERQSVFALGGVMLAAIAFVLPVKLWRGAGFVLMALALAVLVLVSYSASGTRSTAQCAGSLGPVSVQVEARSRDCSCSCTSRATSCAADRAASFAGFAAIRTPAPACRCRRARLRCRDRAAVTPPGVLFLAAALARFRLLPGCAALMAVLALASLYRPQRLTLHAPPDPIRMTPDSSSRSR